MTTEYKMNKDTLSTMYGMIVTNKGTLKPVCPHWAHYLSPNDPNTWYSYDGSCDYCYHEYNDSCPYDKED